ncbi:YciI-like protein [Mesorhizobium xinjiangense]|uniref:YciI-like protein n=1 Tax=Mesorhizobium xinjiangense TaxID=2678685 RepID=UPI0012ECE581|nr:YciI-like protein [Mesorhizobium xinjiangense]
MLFALICTDKPDHLQMRLDTRPDHVAYLDGLNAKGTLKAAGPFLDPDGKPNGSLVIVEAADQGAAEAIAQADPYAVAGLFSSVEIRPWNWVFNAPEQV